MKAVYSLCLLTTTILVSTGAYAKTARPIAPAASAHVVGQGLDIAAEVGGDAITSWDVDNRLRFVIITAKFSNTPDVVARLRPQVIRSLIDEKLQLQEAAKNGIDIPDSDVTQAIAAIEQQRGLQPGSIMQLLKDNHLPDSTFNGQVKAQLAWSKLLTKKIRPQVHISDEEIQLAARKLALPDSAAPEEMKISVLSLPIDKPSREGEMHKLADKIVREVRAGASFEEVSRQFSGGSAGGGSFWVRPEQLDPVVAHALLGAKAGSVSDPLKSGEGYTIVKVYDTRALAGGEEKPKETEVSIKEILLKLKPDVSNKEADVMLQIGEEVTKHPGSCEEKGIAGLENLGDFDIEVNLFKNNLSELPPAVRAIAETLKVGDISTPFASDEGIRLYMLCGKHEVAPKVDHERVYSMLVQQKMELAAQKYMRDLHRDTFIEVR